MTRLSGGDAKSASVNKGRRNRDDDDDDDDTHKRLLLVVVVDLLCPLGIRFEKRIGRLTKDDDDDVAGIILVEKGCGGANAMTVVVDNVIMVMLKSRACRFILSGRDGRLDLIFIIFKLLELSSLLMD